jgi:hypothetical protein
MEVFELSSLAEKMRGENTMRRYHCNQALPGLRKMCVCTFDAAATNTARFEVILQYG